MILITTIITTSLLVSHLTPDPPAPTSSHRNELFKRDQVVCGDLQKQYPNAEAPTCSGRYSVCTFTSGYQGCCNDSGDCQFYTSCQGGQVAATDRCSDTSCLQCPSLMPYCTQYEFAQGQTAYEGYACGHYYVADPIIYGTVGSVTIDTGSTNSSSITTPSSTSSHTSSPTSSSASLASSTASRATSSPNATAANQTATEQKSSNHTGAIVGGVIGGLAIIAVIGLVFWYIRRKQHEEAPPMLEQRRR